MKRSPSGNSQESLDGDYFLTQAQHVMNIESQGQDIWVDQSQAPDDAHILITLSNQQGVHTTFVDHEHVLVANPAHYVQTPPERVATPASKNLGKALSAFRIFSYAILGILVIFSISSALGYTKARVVLTGSMVPTIRPGDIVITVNPTIVKPAIRKVVSYQARQFNGTPVAVLSHRIIGGDAKTGWIVKGDANPSPDVQHPMGKDILGVVVFTIPFIGKFLTKQALFFIIPIVIGLWVAFEGMKEVPEDD